MGRLKWYKRDPNAALVGMADLTLEERGAYNTVLDLIYARDGDLVDDDRIVGRMIGCDPRTWRWIKSRLIGKGKLFVVSGKLHNARADIEIQDAKVKLSGEFYPKVGTSDTKDRHRSSMADIPNDPINQGVTGVTTTTREDTLLYSPSRGKNKNGITGGKQNVRRSRKSTKQALFERTAKLLFGEENEEKASVCDSDEDR